MPLTGSNKKEYQKEYMRAKRKGLTNPIIRFDNGSYLHVNKLVDPKIRGLITYLSENLNPSYQENLRVGFDGPTIKECKKLLEVTA